MVPILNYDYLPKDCLKHLLNYKYQGNDKSLVYNYILSPFANLCLKCTPKTIA
jgi:ethanolaminephosphotransferase